MSSILYLPVRAS